MKTARTTVEHCSKLSIFKLRREGALSHYDGDDYLFGNGIEIPLTKTPCYFGGERFWFICPDCHRRVSILYRPRYSSFFLCRHCHDLTYQSTQHRRTSFEPFAKRLKICEKYHQICAGEGRKGFSKRESSQLMKLMNKIGRLPAFPPKPVIAYKRIKTR
jgi:hypothetical protein